MLLFALLPVSVSGQSLHVHDLHTIGKKSYAQSWNDIFKECPYANDRCKKWAGVLVALARDWPAGEGPDSGLDDIIKGSWDKALSKVTTEDLFDEKVRWSGVLRRFEKIMRTSSFVQVLKKNNKRVEKGMVGPPQGGAPIPLGMVGPPQGKAPIPLGMVGPPQGKAPIPLDPPSGFADLFAEDSADKKNVLSQKKDAPQQVNYEYFDPLPPIKYDYFDPQLAIAGPPQGQPLSPQQQEQAFHYPKLPGQPAENPFRYPSLPPLPAEIQLPQVHINQNKPAHAPVVPNKPAAPQWRPICRNGVMHGYSGLPVGCIATLAKRTDRITLDVLRAEILHWGKMNKWTATPQYRFSVDALSFFFVNENTRHAFSFQKYTDMCTAAGEIEGVGGVPTRMIKQLQKPGTAFPLNSFLRTFADFTTDDSYCNISGNQMNPLWEFTVGRKQYAEAYGKKGCRRWNDNLFAHTLLTMHPDALAKSRMAQGICDESEMIKDVYTALFKKLKSNWDSPLTRVKQGAQRLWDAATPDKGPNPFRVLEGIFGFPEAIANCALSILPSGNSIRNNFEDILDMVSR